MRRSVVAAVALLAVAAPVWAGELLLKDDGKALSVTEDGKPVLSYWYTRVDAPEGVADRFWRSSYIHPLYGLDGDVLTQDFPDDHRHHRGVFWAWPYCAVGERRMDTWAIGSVRQLFDKWLVREETPGYVRVGVQNLWRFDDDAEPKVCEQVFFTVYPADDQGRAIDLALRFQNIAKEEVTFLGAKESDKGYGGFCVRPDKARAPFTFTTARGRAAEDVLQLDTPWADVSSQIAPGEAASGVAIFQHPGNPGYPHHGWILRHYGFLGASWPHNEPCRLAPGQSFELRYRLYIHRGTAEEAGVAAKFEAFAAEAQ
ncbi:MAG: PmoA family protein [Candidatus Hydrogenedentes bacterium]|nr:PmoA family protein [Candidatus Hydrogenedentota bacterium]